MIEALSKDSLILWLNYYGSLCSSTQYRLIHHNGYVSVRKINADGKVSEHRITTNEGIVLYSEYEEYKKNCSLYNSGKKLWKNRYNEDIPVLDIKTLRDSNPFWTEDCFESLKTSYGTIKNQKTGMTPAQQMIIAVLNLYDLKYKYQPKLSINGVNRYINFVVYIPWLYACFPYEHFECQMSEGWDTRCSVAINRYMKAGLIPGVDLLITCENKDIEFDSQLAEKMITNFINQMSAIIIAKYNSGR